MNENYINKIVINQVRHLNNIKINIPSFKHLIFTGKNGSGKTSVLESLRDFLAEHIRSNYTNVGYDSSGIKHIHKRILIHDAREAFLAEFSDSAAIVTKEAEGKFIIAYYPAERQYKVSNETHIKKIAFKDKYGINEHPGNDFVKYLLDMKSSQALYATNGQHDRAEDIKKWFVNFDNVLKHIFDDESVHLNFNIESFAFNIVENGRNPYAFDELSSGYAAVLDIVTDLMMRMEKKSKKAYDLEGIVIIDEIETHLHLSLQKNILPILTKLFPNIQFIISTHSPFVLNSVNNAIIYDLENKTLIDNEEGLSNIPYKGVVEGYFGVSQLSDDLRNKFERYKELFSKKELTDDDIYEIIHLEKYLDNIPNFLALDIMVDYKRMKLELMDRIE